MSLEMNSGILRPAFEEQEGKTEDQLDQMVFSGDYQMIRGKLYRVEWELQQHHPSDGYGSYQVFPDGSVAFFTVHNNSGGHWSDLVAEYLSI